MNRLYFCCDERRRNAVRAHVTLNGIDFLEVDDDPDQPADERQRTLRVHFLKPLTGPPLGRQNVRIEGGERIREIRITAVTPLTGAAADVLVVEVARPGDFATYTLRLTLDAEHPEPPSGYDPLLSAVDFSFKVECPTDFDPGVTPPCPPEPQRAPSIDYLARDYASLRRAMLDRMAVLAPGWQDDHPADLGVALVELMAYVGDYLSYAQDAVATEAYLGTARRRISVGRHARLVDYLMHDGCNARAWVLLQVTAPVDLPRGTRLLTRLDGRPIRLAPDSPALAEAMTERPEVFETMHRARLVPAHNSMRFYTWGARECALPRGATRATLRGQFPELRVGDVLIMTEVRGPRTGAPEDADPSHRHAVRLTAVEPIQDPLGGRFAEPPNDGPVALTNVTWDAADALPFPLCVSARVDTSVFDDVAIVVGNVVLADHGRTTGAPLGSVPEPSLFRAPSSGGQPCQDSQPEPIPPRFEPVLPEGGLSRAVPYDEAAPPPSAVGATSVAPEDARPSVVLQSRLGESVATWRPRRDLLGSDPSAREFVVETDSDGAAHLRFGDDRFGLRPAVGTSFTATYRLGNGSRGNVGAGAIAHVVATDPAIAVVTNLMPARGGVDPEAIEEVRQKASSAFRRQERAVTPDDYATILGRHPQVQRSAATVRWTGSWRTVFLTVDRRGGGPIDAPFELELRRYLERFRMAGQDVEIDAPRFVPLEIELRVVVQPDFFRVDVQRALLEVFSSHARTDGRPGVFHPDNFTFGQPVYLSPIYAAAQAVPGVAEVEIALFQRQDAPSQAALEVGFLEMRRLEIARLDNDPNFPERGVFRVRLEGGR